MKYKFATSSTYKRYSKYERANPQYFKKLNDLISDVCLDPFYIKGGGREPVNGSKGMGWPEYLKHRQRYSREVTKGNRLEYDVVNSEVVIYAVDGHYTSNASLTGEDESFLESVISTF